MIKDPATFEAAHKLAANIAAAAKMNFEVNGFVRAFSFMLARKHPATGVVFDHPQVLPLPLNPFMSDKLVARRVQQEVIQRTDAAWHVFVSECWTVTLDSDELFEDCSQGPSEHPQRTEVIHVCLEHVSGHTAAWQLNITRDAEGRGTVSDPVEFTNKLGGTFTGYFASTRHIEIEA